MERRLLLDAAPVFATALPDSFVIYPNGGGLTIGVDGYDADGDALTVTAESSDPELSFFIPTGNRYARMHFVEADGVTPVGDIVAQLFEGRSSVGTERFITLATNHVNEDGTLDPGGTPFYADIPVHRVVDYFMVQSGDPTGTGYGDSPLPDFGDPNGADLDPVLSYAARGVLGFAHPQGVLDGNNCQFFITEVPTGWLDQVHMIFGQVVSGGDVLQALSQVPTDAQNVWDPPLLQSVEILDSPQDGTITIQATDDFTGEAQVTVTLDDGNGNTTSQVITIADGTGLSSPPTVWLAEDYYVVREGQQDSFEVDIGDGVRATDVSTIVYDGGRGASVTIQPHATEAGRYVVDISIPAGFDAAEINVALVAQWSDVDYDNVTPFVDVFTVSVTGDAPEITIPDASVNVFPGQTFSFDATVVDDFGAAVDVSVETYDAELSDTVSIQPHATEPDTWVVTITVPVAITTSSYSARIVATESGYAYTRPADEAFSVEVAGDRPVIDHTADLFMLAGSPFTFLAQISDDGPTELEVDIEASHADVQVTFDPDTYEVALTAPEEFTGMFTLTMSAVESGFADRDPTVVTVGVFAQADHDPLAIERVDSGGDWAMASVSFGDRLYVAAAEGGLQIYDLTDPLHPVYVRSYATTNVVREVRVIQTEIDGEDATVAFLAQHNGVVVLDVTDPLAITTLTTLQADIPAISLSIENDVLYVAAWNSGLKLYDIWDPEDIFELSTIYDLPGGRTITYAAAVEVHEAYAYVVNPLGTVEVLDAVDPINVQYLTTIYAGSFPWDAAIQEDRLYVADVLNGLVAYDVTTPARPRRLGGLALDGYAAKIAVSGNLALVSLEGAFAFVDISDPARMVATYDFAGAYTYTGIYDYGIPLFAYDPMVYGATAALPFGPDGLALLDADTVLDSFAVDRVRTFRLDDGRMIIVSVAGGGQARVHFADDGSGTIDLLEIFGTGVNSLVSVTAVGGAAQIGEIFAYDSLRGLLAPTADLLGDLTVRGLLSLLTLRNVADPHVLEINTDQLSPGGRELTITLGRVADATLNTHGIPIRSLTAVEWVDSDDADTDAGTITAPKLGQLMTRGDVRAGVPGDFAAGLTLDGVGAPANLPVLGLAIVAGRIDGGTWDVDGAVGPVRAGGTGAGWTLQADGPVTSLYVMDALAGSLSAEYYGVIYALGGLSAGIAASGANPLTGASINYLLAGAVQDVSLNLTSGGINNMIVQSWTDGADPDADAGTITAHWIGALMSRGDFDAGLTLSGTGAPAYRPVLGSALVTGQISGGTWDITGGTGFIRAAGTGAAWALQATGSVTYLMTMGAMGGSASAAYFGSVIALGDLSASISAGGADPRTGASINYLSAGSVRDVSLNLTSGGVNVVVVRQWVDGPDGDTDAGTITANWIGTLISRGDFDAGLTLSGVGTPTYRAVLGSALVLGRMNGGTWDINGTGDVGFIRAAGTGAAWSLDAAGPVRYVTVTGELGGSLSAQYFGTIVAVGDLTAGIGATGVDAASRAAINLLSAGSVKDVTLSLVSGGINIVYVREWIDGADAGTDAGSLQADWIGTLYVRGDFLGALTLTGDSPPPNRPVLGTAVITGALGSPTAAATVQGNAGTILIGSLGGDLTVVGSAGVIRTTQAMGLVPAPTGDTARLHVDGTAMVLAGIQRITLSGGDLYANGRYRVEADLRYYDVQGASWDYDLAYTIDRQSGTDTCSVDVPSSAGGNYQVRTVSTSTYAADQIEDFSTAPGGEVLLVGYRENISANEYLDVDYTGSPQILPATVAVGESYTLAAPFTGSFAVEEDGELIEGTCSGTNNFTTRVVGYEQVTVELPGGPQTFLAVKVETRTYLINGRLQFELDGTDYTGTLILIATDTAWFVPNVGGVRQTVQETIYMIVPGAGVWIETTSSTMALTDYSLP